MRKFLLFMAIMLAIVPGLAAQDLSVPQRVLSLSGGYQPFTLSSTMPSQIFDVTGMDSHAVSYTFPSNVTGVTVTVSGSTDGGLTFATIATSTSGAGTISFTGTFFAVKVTETGMTAATAALAGVYNGTLMAGHAVTIAGTSGNTAVPFAVNSAGVLSVVIANTSGTSGELVSITASSGGAPSFSAGVMGSAIAVSTTTSAPFGTITTLVQGLYLNNSCQAPVTVTATDGNNVPFLGTTTNGASFSIPAVGNLSLNMGIVGHVFTGGLQISASVAGCAKLWVEGKE